MYNAFHHTEDVANVLMALAALNLPDLKARGVQVSSISELIYLSMYLYANSLWGFGDLG